MVGPLDHGDDLESEFGGGPSGTGLDRSFAGARGSPPWRRVSRRGDLANGSVEVVVGELMQGSPGSGLAAAIGVDHAASHVSASWTVDRNASIERDSHTAADEAARDSI